MSLVANAPVTRRLRPTRYPRRVLVTMGDRIPAPVGRTRDVSKTGIFVDTPSRLRVGATRWIGLAWGHQLVSCRVRVVRHTDDGMAMQFVRPTDDFRRAINRMVLGWDPEGFRARSQL